MVNDLRANSPAPTKVDTAASDACTRSGIVALLLSVALLLLIPYWVHRPAVVALGRYVAIRDELAVNLTELKDDLFWQHYVASHPEANSMSISKLLKLQVDESFISKAASGKRPLKHPTVAKKAPARKINTDSGTVLLPAPGMLTAKPFGNISEMRPIADFFSKLNDPDLLTQARQFSYFFNLSIFTWATKRNDLLVQRIDTSDCYRGKGNPMASYKVPAPAFFVPAIKKDVLLNCFTLRDVRELARFQLPRVTNPTQLGGSVGQQVEISTGSLPHDPLMASIAAQIVLFFVIVYFTTFAGEAILSPDFPAPGTLFGAFSRSPWGLVALFLALCSPLFASLGVAYCSGKWQLIVCSLAIFVAVSAVFRVLQRKSYFGPLFQTFTQRFALRD